MPDLLPPHQQPPAAAAPRPDSHDESQARAARRAHLRRAAILVGIALLLLLGFLLLLGLGTPAWLPDGSRGAAPLPARIFMGLSLVTGTVLLVLGLRSAVLFVLPFKAVGTILTVLVVIASVVAAPIEIWLSFELSKALGPGSRERSQSHGGDWD